MLARMVGGLSGGGPCQCHPSACSEATGLSGEHLSRVWKGRLKSHAAAGDTSCVTRAKRRSHMHGGDVTMTRHGRPTS